MLDFIKSILNFLLRLVESHNTTALIIFTVILVLFFSALLGMFWLFLRKDSFDEEFPLLFLRVRLYGGKKLLKDRRYNKLLYVKVLYLTRRQPGATPVYTRDVSRLGPDQKPVDVYDEAVYYTLKLFPDTRPVAYEQDRSKDGVVDPRLVIPWDPSLKFDRDTLGVQSNIAAYGTRSETDTMLTVSHFLNGLQGRHQCFCTVADEDTESLRLIVDFSSVPNADTLIVKTPEATLFVNEDPTDADVTCKELSPGLFMAHCMNVQTGATLRMDFAFSLWPDTKAPSGPCA